jgi:hypothetical protein
VNSHRKEGIRMKRKLCFLLSLAILLQLPSLGLAECTNIGGFTNFSLEGNNTVILYAGSLPVARFDILDCNVQPTSKIQLIKSDVCDGDEIMIDGSRCTMMEIKPLGP